MRGNRENMIRDKSGAVALILVVWIMVILIAIVTEFSYSMRTEINITQNFKEEEEAYQLALAGIEYAKAEVGAVEETQRVFVNREEVLILDENIIEPVRKKNLGRGSFEYTITDEDGKLDINMATQEQLKYVLIESGVDSDKAAGIADSILDWRDTNDLHMLNGAEEDYYRDLDEPYSCKDGPFDSIQELLLVKGMTDEILYGSVVDEEEEKTYSGILSALTVNGTNRINVNTAPGVVIEAVIGLEAADNIILQRETGPVSDIPNNAKLASDFFTIISKGTNADGSIKRSVKAVVYNGSDKMEIIYWNDNFIR